MRRYKNVPVVDPTDYWDTINQHEECIVLLIAADASQLRMVPYLSGTAGDAYCFATPVSSEEAHIVEVARVPRLRLYVKGEMKRNALLNMDDVASIQQHLAEFAIQRDP